MVRSLADRTFQLRSSPRGSTALGSTLSGASSPRRCHPTWVERFDRRGIEPFELFTSEFGQNSVKIQYILLENLKNSGLIFFQHFRKYLRNSDKISSNSEQNSMNFFLTNEQILQNLPKNAKQIDDFFLKY